MSENLALVIKRPDILGKFTEIMGDNNGKSYVQSVLLAVAASPELMKCSHESIIRSALRAASLGLSCDPALKQAWLVPYNRKVKNNGTEEWVKEAQFQPHYKGLYTLAMRTGKYWNINVSPVYEGQRVLENPLTGLRLVQESDGFVGEHPGKYAGYNDVTNRRKKNLKVIGWLGYFKVKRGFEKSVWMSTEEIADHAAKYVRDYDKNPNWNDDDKRAVMEMKTVLRQLLSWADLSGTEDSTLVQALQADEPEVIESETETDAVIPAVTIAQARQVVVKIGKKEKFIGELDIESLNALYTGEQSTDEQRQAAALVLFHDNNMDAPDQPKRTKQQNLKELGF